jgi:hypothetical protein
MKIRSAVGIAAVAGFAVGLTGCPADSCSLESPQVGAIPGSCTEVAGQPVNYPVRLCPTCNQTGATCVADVSKAVTDGVIYLDMKVEACSGGNSCPPPTCLTNATTCTFTAPTTPGTYAVLIYDAGQQTTIQRPLEVIASGAESCALPVAGI